MDIGRLTGQKGVCSTCGQRGHWAAECPKRGKVGQGGKGDDGKGQGKKGKAVKGKADGGKGKGKGGKLQVRQVFGGHCKHCWEWGHMEKDCFTLTKTRARVVKAKVPAVLMKLRQAVRNTLQLVDLVFVTEEGLHRCVNFRVAPVHKAVLSASKVCQQGISIILGSEAGQSGMLHKQTRSGW